MLDGMRIGCLPRNRRATSGSNGVTDTSGTSAHQCPSGDTVSDVSSNVSRAVRSTTSLRLCDSGRAHLRTPSWLCTSCRSEKTCDWKTSSSGTGLPEILQKRSFTPLRSKPPTELLDSGPRLVDPVATWQTLSLRGRLMCQSNTSMTSTVLI